MYATWRRLASRVHTVSLALAFGAFLALSTVGSYMLSAGRGTRAAQPLAFNHRLHVEEGGLDCSDCHVHYETEAFSGLPGSDTCGMCHDEAQTEAAAEQELVRIVQAGGELDWEPLFRQPGHVFYSHRRHVVVAQMECEECHGDFALTEIPPQTVQALSMDECIACHEAREISNNCTDCHR